MSSQAPASAIPPKGSEEEGEKKASLLASLPGGIFRMDSAALTYYALLISTLFLLVLGLSMVFSVQSVTMAAVGRNPYTSFIRYLGISLAGVIGMIAVSRIPQRWLITLAIPSLSAAIALQFLVYVPGLKTCAGGNCNWIKVPLIGTAQPSEFIKLAIVLYLGWVVATRPQQLTGIWPTIKILSPAVVAVALVLGGGDLGTVVILALLMAGALWMAGLGSRWFMVLGGLGFLLFGGFTLLSANRRARINAWLDPTGSDPMDVGYQPLHGRYALGTGGWAGVGPGSSRQKWGYLTQADSDYIFAVLGEELGLVGTLLVIVLFAVVGWCCLRIMKNTNSVYVTVVTGGIAAWLVGQALVNMCVVVGLLPVLGVPLPLISAGGSSLLFVLAAIGVLLSFARAQAAELGMFSVRPAAARRTLSVISPSRRNRA